MFNRSHLSLAVTLSAALGLAACGSKSTGPSFASVISDSGATAAAATAEDIAGNLDYVFDFQGTSIGFAPQAPPQGVAILNGAWMRATHSQTPRYTIKGMAMAPVIDLSSASGCANNGLTISGDTTDADGDGIPANETITISCDTTYPNGTVASDHGTFVLQDTPGLYGFHVSISITETSTDTAHNVESLAINGTEDAAFTASLAHDQVNVTFSDGLTVAGHTTGLGSHQDWDATFTPTSDALSLTDPLPDGAIHFTGGFYLLDLGNSANNFNFTIATTSDLDYLSSCAGQSDPYSAGVITGKFNGQANVGFTVTYNNGCNNAPTVSGHGNAS